MLNNDLYVEGQEAFKSHTPRANPYIAQELGTTAPQSWLLGYLEAQNEHIKTLTATVNRLEDNVAEDKLALDVWKTDLTIKLSSPAPKSKAKVAPKKEAARVRDLPDPKEED
tara:strand:- start:11186 stop:11521 length:336 start_codon:yes stop_codon:yes gene_type:complete